MATLQDIRRRIGSVENTEKITKAMEAVATVKLRRAQQRIEALRPYALSMIDLMRDLAALVVNRWPTSRRPGGELCARGTDLRFDGVLGRLRALSAAPATTGPVQSPCALVAHCGRSPTTNIVRYFNKCSLRG